jgi:hypothetical protein
MVHLKSKVTEGAIISTFVAARRAPVPADLSLPRRRVSGTLGAANLTVDRKELRISVFVKRCARGRAEWTGTQLDAFSEKQRPASPHRLIFRALGHRRLHPVTHTKALRLGFSATYRRTGEQASECPLWVEKPTLFQIGCDRGAPRPI